MFRYLCKAERRHIDPGWAIGSSLAIVIAALALSLLDAAEPFAMALVYAAFPMAMLVSDPAIRRRPLRRLLPALALAYSAMLGVARLSEII